MSLCALAVIVGLGLANAAARDGGLTCGGVCRTVHDGFRISRGGGGRWPDDFAFDQKLPH